MAATAFGQVRVGADGHAADANPRVGSGGFNTSAQQDTIVVTGNDIASGNVTGGFAFRGRRPFTDPAAFHGLPGEGMDAFIRDSAGVPTMAHPFVTSLSEGPRPFYPASVTATPPGGFTAVSSSGGNYYVTPAVTPQPEDLRLGQSLSTDVPMPKPGELLLPGQVDPTATVNPQPSQMYYASPLYGVRMWQLGEQQNPAGPGTQNPAEQPTSPEQQRILEMRRELSESASSEQQQQSANDQNNPANPANPENPAVPGGAKPLPPLMAGGTETNPHQPLKPLQVGASTVIKPTDLTPVAGNMSTAPLSNWTLPAPWQQSSQLAEMHRRLEQYNKTHLSTEEQANRQFLSDLQARRMGAAPGAPAIPGLPATPGTPAAPGAPSMTPSEKQPNPEPSVVVPAPQVTSSDTLPNPGPSPLQVSSLAQGVKSKAMADLLRRAEEYVKHQQYSKAIGSYDEAEQVAPNNALVPIGRANAEMGGSYYRQAEADLRAAFKQDPSVLMAQYDLQSLLGEQRLQFIVSDLKQIASDSPQNPTPVFLLAYIAYNTHHEDKAAGWLDVAAKRAGGTDDIVPMLKKYWRLTPSTQPSTPTH